MSTRPHFSSLFMALAFVPGYLPPAPRLLGRFLPPLVDGVAAHFIQQHTQPGDLVFDPFGQAPAVAVEALNLNRRVVVASFNPISRLSLSLALRPPAVTQLRAALTALADAPMGQSSGGRLELYIGDLYRSTCSECQSAVTVDFFEWDAEAGEPVEKAYVCARCAGPQSAPADAADKALAARFSRTGLDHYYLLDRVAAVDDPERAQAQDAMLVYPPRTLAAIGAALLKFDTLSIDRESRRLLAGLLVAALDRTAALAQERPKALSLPRRFREYNFWQALESALGLMAGVPMPDRSASLDELLSNPGRAAIYAHAGAVRDLAARLPPGSVALLLSAIPRPNQAFWTLSALWSAWLWGHESADTLRTVLRRRRYDWAWHARALQRTAAPLLQALAPGGRAVGLVTEAEPGLTASVFAAAAGAGFALDGAVLRGDTAEAQYVWRVSKRRAGAGISELDVQRELRQAMLGCLVRRAEPTRWSNVHFAGWQALAAGRLLAWRTEEPLGGVNRALEQIARDGRMFRRLGASAESDATTGLWFVPAALDGGRESLADRVEAEVLRQLADRRPRDAREVDEVVCAACPGEQTPGRGLILACLGSYADHLESGLWRLRAEDAPGARDAELQSIAAGLSALAERLGFEVSGDLAQEWRDTGQPTYWFALLATGAISRALLGPSAPVRRRYLVLPAGRAGLAEFKLRRDPRLRAALREGQWTIVKFRHIRRVIADADLRRSEFEIALAGDPLEASQQLALLL